MTAGFHCSALFSSSPPSCRDLEIWQRREVSQKENTLHMVMKVMNSEEKKGKKEDKEDQRLTSSDSFEKVEEVDVSLVHICSAGENEKHEGERIRSLLLDGMEEVECCDEMCSDVGSSSLGQKKRRLSVDQVRALEKDFEVENKLDPERKIKLARELGLRPRQIAIWFQNRRARWKTKQLERDFGALKTLHDALKLDVDTLRDDKEALISEIRVLKDKLADSAMAKIAEIEVVKEGEGGEVTAFKDGTLDTDSSAVLSGGSAGYLGRSEMSRCSSFLFEYHRMVGDDNSKSYLEEGLFTGEEFCRSVSPEEQEPSLSW